MDKSETYAQSEGMKSVSPECPKVLVDLLRSKAMEIGKSMGREFLNRDLVIPDEAFDVIAPHFIACSLEMCRSVLQNYDALKSDRKIKEWIDYRA